MKKDVIWSWTKDDEEIIETLKQLCQNLPELYHPADDDLIIIETDASHECWGGVMKAKPLGQKKELLCRYMSGTFSDAEINYPTHEKETLALTRMLEKHRIYVLDKEFIVRTDSTYVAGFKNINHKGTYKQGRLIRWQMKLAEYNYSISHIKGEKNVLADILSREWNKAQQK